MYIHNTMVRRIINWIGKVIGKYPLVYAPIPSDSNIMFSRRDRDNFGFLSNFYPSKIQINEAVWPDVEHYYQSEKSTDAEYHAVVMNASSPGKAKRLGDSRIESSKMAKQSWFRKRPDLLRTDWNEIKLLVMKRAIWAKFTQNQDLRKMILATKEAILIEDSQTDSFWGWGRDKNGENNLGKLLMEVRNGFHKKS